MSSRDEVEIEVTVRARTVLALQVDNGSVVVWVPRSLITDWAPDTDNELEITSIFMQEWAAIEKGLV